MFYLTAPHRIHPSDTSPLAVQPSVAIGGFFQIDKHERQCERWSAAGSCSAISRRPIQTFVSDLLFFSCKRMHNTTPSIHLSIRASPAIQTLPAISRACHAMPSYYNAKLFLTHSQLPLQTTTLLPHYHHSSCDAASSIASLAHSLHLP